VHTHAHAARLTTRASSQGVAFDVAGVFWQLASEGHRHLKPMGLTTSLLDAAVDAAVREVAPTVGFQRLAARRVLLVLGCLAAMYDTRSKARALPLQQRQCALHMAWHSPGYPPAAWTGCKRRRRSSSAATTLNRRRLLPTR
jgi:hypothetical protein